MTGIRDTRWIRWLSIVDVDIRRRIDDNSRAGQLVDRIRSLLLRHE